MLCTGITSLSTAVQCCESPGIRSFLLTYRVFAYRYVSVLCAGRTSLSTAFLHHRKSSIFRRFHLRQYYHGSIAAAGFSATGITAQSICTDRLSPAMSDTPKTRSIAGLLFEARMILFFTSNARQQALGLTQYSRTIRMFAASAKKKPENRCIFAHIPV